MKIFAGRRSKKGDLSLSINSIVILILAITVLGLGLTFIRGIFKQAESKTASAFEATKLKRAPTSDEPVTVESPLTVQAGKSKTIEIGIYNTLTGPTDTNTLIAAKPELHSENCVPSNSAHTVDDETFTLAAASAAIPPREARGYPAILTAKEGTDIDTYICTITVTSEEPPATPDISAQIFIEVR